MAAKQLNTDAIKGKLLQGSFMNNGPSVMQLSDPIVDTPMVVTLDKLRSYEFNPRLNRNPLFDELKASILSRGLDAPPPITRRPGEEFYIIRNGGNTRLAILNELWRETRDEQYLRINCLFRPWPERGDIVALTGHLAENDMHGELTFVERALGIDRAKEFYEQEANEPISQRELARKLAADGYPVSQPHISKMQDTIQYLLPAIPTVLYAGLGKPQIERLIALRRSAEKTWVKYAPRHALDVDFTSLFVEVLSTFDDGADFKVDRFQDELIHHMQQPLGKEYNWLKLDILEAKTQPLDHRVHTSGGQEKPLQVAPPVEKYQPPRDKAEGAGASARSAPPKSPERSATPPPPAQYENNDPEVLEAERQERIQAHIVSPIPGLTPRTQAMKKQLAQATGEPIPDFEESCLHSIPVQVGGLHPIADLWYIERQIDEPNELRNQILGLASEIANEVGVSAQICSSEWGIGFRVGGLTHESLGSLQASTLNLLGALCSGFRDPEFELDLGNLFLGRPKLEPQAASIANRLSDQALVKVFRVMRLARRLIELEASPAD
ncbi:ParB family protein [Pseudomonas sp. NA-150]|uniref:ParB family protein n=1 Tax=Pseudomonas sp. NA-150 TaxID=3367525 RepID=UPI0037C5500A